MRKFTSANLAEVFIFFMKKMINAVEYREQHLFRRSAIERLISRKIFIEGGLNNLGIQVVKELIKTRYLANDTVSSTTVEDIDKIVRRYHELFRSLESLKDKRSKQYQKDILVMTACEIETTIWPNKEELAFLTLLTQHFLKASARLRILIGQLS
jgi:hypothetical protein